ncbi:MAG TPA: hypothetical protein VER96_40670 [Polyangiaceae bacterium]|nr:hypothetical protein [Polyangiaceae bacterium]
MRAARALLFAIGLAGGVACAETVQGPLAGASDAWASAPEPTLAPTPTQPRPEWEGYRDVLRMPVVTPTPITSRGHLPEQSVEVRANEVARTRYGSLVTDTVFPDGSVLAELSRSGGNGYVMRKTGGAWNYFELDSRGQTLAGGAPALCAGCHAQAQSDGVFGLPRTP